MSAPKFRYEKNHEKLWKARIPAPLIPDYITKNLKYSLFTWQQEALTEFLSDELVRTALEKSNAPTHLMFNMATGTGKTLLMAALILHYYKKGYRHFIFFVNQNNIVGKTEENLLNPNHNKYLFQPVIVIDDKTVQIKKVDSFSDNVDDIQILFTSIHKLHNAVYTVKENSVYLEDLQKRRIVMLGDEAHHLNADTKKKTKQAELDLPVALSEKASDADVEKSWENTVIKRILYKDENPIDQENENVLLEFTATIPRDEAVKEKYIDKTIYKFDLKDFLTAGYTKEINLISSSFKKKQRVLQALLFNWYRNKIALKYGLQNFKPVILFRSKLIETSKNDFEEFKQLIKELSVKDFSFLSEIQEQETSDGSLVYEKGKSRILDIKHFIAENNIEWNEIIRYLQYSFSERNCIITNSKNGTKTIEKTTDEQEDLLNSLEDKNNHITAIFTVQRLTEGWDVLNLFDIVRLYEGQNEGGSNKRTSEATTSEVQLIGRGIRYYPFAYQQKPLLKRKFDDDLGHELRVLEEFYYHSDNEHRYLSQLTKELKDKGYIDTKKKIKIFGIRQEIKATDFYANIPLWSNDRQDNPARRKTTLEEIKDEFSFEESVKSGSAEETRIEMDKDEDTARYVTANNGNKTLYAKLKDFERHIIRKAISVKAKRDRSIFRFENLKTELLIESVDELMEDQFLGEFGLNIIVSENTRQLSDISNELQLALLLKFFDKIEKSLKEILNPYVGSHFYPKKLSAVFETAKEKIVEEDEDSIALEKELLQDGWYMLNSFTGTSEERSLVRFLKSIIVNLKSKYEEVYLLRNEEVYTIYDFEKGRGFQPDFLLFTAEKNKEVYYQLFIEPKGSQFFDSSGGFTESKEAWKEEFLKEITRRYYEGSEILKFENVCYQLIGLPLYNDTKKEDFRTEINEKLSLEN